MQKVFFICVAECRHKNEDYSIVRFADTRLISNEDDSGQDIHYLVALNIYLQLNVKHVKEIIVQLRKDEVVSDEILIKGEVEEWTVTTNISI